MGWLEDNENYLNEANAESQALKAREQMKQQEKENFVDSVLSDEESKEQLKEQLGEDATDEEIKQYLEENYENFIPEQYVVRGARLFCSCGSHERKLNVFKDHAIYTESFPMVHELDKELEKNITFFGVCSSGDPLLSSQNIKLIRTTYDEEGNPIEDVVSGAMCIPFIIGNWRDTKQNVKIIDNGDKDGGDKDKYREDSGKGYKAVTTKSFLICRYGGIIEPLDSGQDLIDEKETEEIDHYKTMKESYGFNEEQVDLILKSYDLFEKHIQGKNLSRKEKIHEYFENMAALCINYSGTATRWKWSGLPTTKEAINYFKQIGLNDQEVSDLFALINKQHSDENNFNLMVGDKIKEDEGILLGEDFLYSKNFDYNYKEGIKHNKDFAHELVQYAVFSSDALFVQIADKFIGDYNNLISYKGDVFSVRMETDDMNSDLDAVNIYNLFMDSNNSFLDIITKYNNQVINNDINRAEEFLKYFGNGNIDEGLEYIKGDLIDGDIGSHYISNCTDGTIKTGLHFIFFWGDKHYVNRDDIKNKRQEFLEYLENELEKGKSKNENN